jgi:signal transduction histidine kinase
MLLIAAVVAYVSIRSIMIADLDSLLYARAIGLPELVHAQVPDPSNPPQYDWADSYNITPDPARSIDKTSKPVLLSATFTQDADGQDQRTLQVAATSHARSGGITPVLVSYSGSMAHLNSLLNRIQLALIGFVAVATGMAAAVAIIASRIVLRPLKSTAHLIGAFDEQTLQDRIPVTGMPSELVPVVNGLNELLARLERAFANQKRFVASASHELRTPVAALATTLELAERRHREPQGLHDTMTQCLSQAHVLRVLVERLMEYVSTDTVSEEPVQDVDVSLLINQCLDAAAAIGSLKNVEIVRSGPRPIFCRVPPNRVRSVVMNLLSNAVEHNRDGGRVEMTWIHDGEKLCARISDNGPGIAPEHLPNLFAPFYRGQKSGTEKGGHLGLGLFIVHSHLKAMNGNCTVDSKLNEGAAFQVEIPCQKLQTPAPSASMVVSA